MNSKQWSKRVGGHQAHARAGGRRRYNAARQAQMWRRRFALLRLLGRVEAIPRGIQPVLAERFGVSQPVISRDLAWVRGEMGAGGFARLHRCSYRRGVVTVEWRYP